jgi:hypothetical protein
MLLKTLLKQTHSTFKSVGALCSILTPIIFLISIIWGISRYVQVQDAQGLQLLEVKNLTAFVTEENRKDHKAIKSEILSVKQSIDILNRALGTVSLNKE